MRIEMRIRDGRCQDHKMEDADSFHDGPPGRLFVVGEESFRRFTKALNKKPAPNRRLQRLLAAEALWELLKAGIQAKIN